jgi:hypothetical protein
MRFHDIFFVLFSLTVSASHTPPPWTPNLKRPGFKRKQNIRLQLNRDNRDDASLSINFNLARRVLDYSACVTPSINSGQIAYDVSLI